MKLSRLERADEWEVRDWLLENIVELTPYQKEKLRDNETLRFAPYYFYKRPKKDKYSILWRVTLVVFPFYLLAIIIFNPIKWIFTGNWGYGRNFMDNFHYKWCKRLDL